ncbi:acetate--CoA ligase [Psychrobacillus sp. FSL K6-2684]|uniref:acetate--CoA ligase n=1 Tax=Psychrobacillus faecigallinarum TaxID=2762235 RepID=A0ABR8R6R8_9BACI|nr:MULTISPECIES: acetate--CoA ligase [Psychrobacillus]MBD7943498.1 acetate--CoA ligase [Psychrobacillus faecigallinarum]QEY22659.1 acetate--CoA ligase [Psychrobacillus sp. AK 1817]QGM29530.1 acetate--CoA ligase [Bacillus sp. N3536]
MKIEALPVVQEEYQLKDYDATARDFQWEEAEKTFTWYETGKVNMAYEAIDRHAKSDKKDKVALYYQDADRKESYTFGDMKTWTDKAANVYKEHSNLAKGDRLFIFMPRSPELYFALLGAVKMGTIVGPLFEAFMEGAVYDRLLDSEAKAIVTTPDLLGRIPLDRLPDLETVFLVGDNIKEDDKFIDFNKALKNASDAFEIEWVDKEDGLILHYTSGSTGKPKGILHVHYAMVQQYQSMKWVMDIRDDDIYWCTADPGWVTGTSYGIFGPWLAGTTSLILGGRFSPDAWYKAIEEYKITVWYSAPTAFRMLMGAGDGIVKKYDLTSLRHVLSVGEPLNPEVIKWGMQVFNKRIHDTWWMTETGAQMICNYGCLPIKPGSMGKPLPGVKAAIIDNNGVEVPPFTMGNLAIKKGWPSMMRQVWKNQEKFESYFINDEWYFSGDSAYMDDDGYFWFQGRVDDVIMTSGERVGPFEVESKLLEHPAILEAGVIGKPDPVRGEIIKAFVALNEGYEPSDELIEEIQQFVKKGLAAHAAPREIEFKDKLPKTRSGKIMRRVLKAWELQLPTGDLSTMED